MLKHSELDMGDRYMLPIKKSPAFIKNMPSLRGLGNRQVVRLPPDNSTEKQRNIGSTINRRVEQRRGGTTSIDRRELNFRGRRNSDRVPTPEQQLPQEPPQ